MKSTHCKKCGADLEDNRYGRSALCKICGKEDANIRGKDVRERNNLLKGQYRPCVQHVDHSAVTHERWNKRHKLLLEKYAREARIAEKNLSSEDYK
jgi:uncharacterized Zn finger protein (UPF0148 family)